MEINRILVFQEIPPGWTLLNGALTPPVGYKLICNGKSRFSADYKTGLIEDNPQTEPPPISEKVETFPFPMNRYYLKSSTSLRENR